MQVRFTKWVLSKSRLVTMYCTWKLRGSGYWNGIRKTEWTGTINPHLNTTLNTTGMAWDNINKTRVSAIHFSIYAVSFITIFWTIAKILQIYCRGILIWVTLALNDTPTTELRDVTCHMESHTTRHQWTCHALSHLIYLRWRDGRLSWPRLPSNATPGSQTRNPWSQVQCPNHC